MSNFVNLSYFQTVSTLLCCDLSLVGLPTFPIVLIATTCCVSPVQTHLYFVVHCPALDYQSCDFPVVTCVVPVFAFMQKSKSGTSWTFNLNWTELKRTFKGSDLSVVSCLAGFETLVDQIEYFISSGAEGQKLLFTGGTSERSQEEGRKNDKENYRSMCWSSCPDSFWYLCGYHLSIRCSHSPTFSLTPHF